MANPLLHSRRWCWLWILSADPNGDSVDRQNCFDMHMEAQFVPSEAAQESA